MFLIQQATNTDLGEADLAIALTAEAALTALPMAAELLRDNGETDRCIAWTTAAVFAPRPTLATARCNGDTERSLGGEVDDSCDAEAFGPHDITERK